MVVLTGEFGSTALLFGAGAHRTAPEGGRALFFISPTYNPHEMRDYPSVLNCSGHEKGVVESHFMYPYRLYLGVFLTVCLTLNLTGSTVYVDVSSTNATPPFSAWNTAANNIQDAVDVSSDGDIIMVTNGIYSVGGSLVYGTLSNRVVVNKAVSVQSVNGPSVTAIYGNPTNDDTAVRCVYLTNNASLTGFTLSLGGTRSSGDPLQEQSGAGIWCETTNVFVTHCVFTSNLAANFGGGAYQGTLIDCSFTNNSSAQGGGVYGGVISNSFLLNNASGEGGGAALSVLDKCFLGGNTAG